MTTVECIVYTEDKPPQYDFVNVLDGNGRGAGGKTVKLSDNTEIYFPDDLNLPSKDVISRERYDTLVEEKLSLEREFNAFKMKYAPQLEYGGSL